MDKIPAPARQRRASISPTSRAAFCFAIYGITMGISCDGGTSRPSPCSSVPDAIHLLLDTGECLQLTSAGYTLQTSSQLYEVLINSRDLPTEIASGQTRLILTWADNAASLRMIISDGGESQTIEFPTDLSDPALLAALDAFAARTGTDVSAFGAYITANPGLILALATGTQPASRLKPTAFDTDKPRVDAAQNQPAFRNMQEYLDSLSRLGMQPIWWSHDLEGEITRAGREPTRLESLAMDFAETLSHVLMRAWAHEHFACIPCTPDCAFGCMGACTRQSGPFTTCDNARSTDCPPPNRFEAGAACSLGQTGACCIFSYISGEFLECRDLSPAACDDVGGRFSFGEYCAARDCNLGGACCMDGWNCRDVADFVSCNIESDRAGARYHQFSPGESCAAIQAEGSCSEGVCCYGDGSYNCDYDEETCQLSERPGAHWVPGRCEAATCR
jgi:hypothetical protein